MRWPFWARLAIGIPVIGLGGYAIYDGISDIRAGMSGLPACDDQEVVATVGQVLAAHNLKMVHLVDIRQTATQTSARVCSGTAQIDDRTSWLGNYVIANGGNGHVRVQAHFTRNQPF